MEQKILNPSKNKQQGNSTGWGNSICPKCQSPLAQTFDSNYGQCSNCYWKPPVAPATGAPATGAPATGAPAKPLESNDSSIIVTPKLLSLFNHDKNRIQDFYDSLNQEEQSIMKENIHDIKVIKELKHTIESDIEDTAKQLEMEN